MRLRQISESKFFDYSSLSNTMWKDKIYDAQKEFNINFDLENDDSDTERSIKIDNDGKATFDCQLCIAGGDWESSVIYFRCQLKDGYATGLDRFTDPYFVFIPSKTQGNFSLKKSKKGFVASDANEDDCEDNDEKKCWDSLKEHLEKLAYKAIDNIK